MSGIDEGETTRPPEGPRDRSASPSRAVWASFGLALGVRTILALRTEVINSDGPAFISFARAFLRAGWQGSIELAGFSPLYPALIALVAATGLPIELAAYGVTCLFGALVVFPLYVLARAAFEERVALATVVLYAFLPVPARLSAALFTTAPFLFLALSTLALTARLARRPSATSALAAGCVAALAYATRPDGLLLVPFLLAGAAAARAWRPRWRVLLAVLALLPVAALVFALQHLAGSPESSPLTQKLSKEGWERFLQVFLPTPYVLKVIWEDLAESMFVPFVPFAVIGFAAPAPRTGRVLRVAALLVCLLWMFTFLKYAGTMGGMSKRHASLLAVVLLPWTVQGLLLLAAGLTRTFGMAPARATLAIVALACAACVPKLLKTHEGERFVERAAGEYLRSLPGPRGPILSGSACIAYYAEAPWGSVYLARHPRDEAFRRIRRSGIRYVARDRGLIDFAPEFARSLGPPDATLVREVRVPGCKSSVDIFRVVYPAPKESRDGD